MNSFLGQANAEEIEPNRVKKINCNRSVLQVKCCLNEAM